MADNNIQVFDPTKHDCNNTDLLNFYRAAANFYESKVWIGLSATMHRTFALSKPRKNNVTTTTTFPSFDPAKLAPLQPTLQTLPIGQPVHLCGIQSSQHAHYNGELGELIGTSPNQKKR